MKFIKKLILILSLIIVQITPTVYASYNYKIKGEININNMFNIQSKKLIENEEFFLANISYPSLIIKEEYLKDKDYNKNTIKKINDDIYNDVIKFRNKIKIQSQEYGKKYETIFSKSKEKYPKYQYETYGDYDVTYNKNNLISIPIKTYEFTGGAHGMNYLNAYNYDLLSGKKLELKDMFKENVDYKNVVNKFVDKEIKKNKDLYFSGDDGFKGISDNQSFYIDNDGIVVYFDVYEIAPYYIGIPKFKMKYDEFGSYLRYTK